MKQYFEIYKESTNMKPEKTDKLLSGSRTELNWLIQQGNAGPAFPLVRDVQQVVGGFHVPTKVGKGKLPWEQRDLF